ncbi:trypsin-7-like [Oppia nitens]|uniref:trypsin-7-like n=1 Tax=Oppia nitens TaxID=1686743 RepID=UPI0023D9AE7A|nr:trypsin-7-like [Oppia nitens]
MPIILSIIHQFNCSTINTNNKNNHVANTTIITIINLSNNNNNNTIYTNTTTTVPNNKGPLIIGGTEAQAGDNPHQCSLRWDGQHKCGASIISANWLLTAAHCIPGDHDILSVRCATLFYGEPGLDFKVSQVIEHDQFDGFDYDIALVKVSDDIPLGTPDLDKIGLPDQDMDPDPGTVLTVTGWGYRDYKVEVLSDRLMTVDVPVVDRQVCADDLLDIHEVTDRMLCAGYDEGGRDACQGDSGGPIKHDGLLVGVVSWGKDCGLPHYPGVYARVGYFRDWIRDKSGV